MGHYFQGQHGNKGSYCINASCLDFIPLTQQQEEDSTIGTTSKHQPGHFCGPTSYRAWEQYANDEHNKKSHSCQLLHQVVQEHVKTSTIVLGGGCFWSIEAALRRLPGVIDTAVGYAGGTQPAPTYEHVCSSERNDGYAEVVQVTWNEQIFPLRQLVDCFLALHDPTKVREHGKHAPLTGQYRSCVFCTDLSQVSVVQEALEECQQALGKQVSTQVVADMPFWKAEDRHQRYEERRQDRITDTDTLSVTEWLQLYGRRKPSVLGTALTLEESVALSRFSI